ncbi:PQQ-dependent sugar dehydrogenase [Halomonas sp. McH1-25]|uniref:PQQ-dependent sugar dehydrogenase n=1 Tax=unclassified Halomonas TaxID=2609666 RepID=UPI001EF5675F|nr:MULTISPECIES: PQQ-dependent sugar dehydrogenase [unclassified Halomonas]MCG7601992.1 PQQ-dependent sugar dehydrogenase [Halomonas sp. McH1-25]MCP1341567.1 PQQ-dependent sugar dehydrogenase [Halomonas sp. FL8]MCP1360213.1 PQQ-dependent sugar dehydrogenase [Halomonas sp. BBD45]MCP1364817.1 PQQ-dependent sugar dehydrogenase [Halomonas sp. BBD48]
MKNRTLATTCLLAGTPFFSAAFAQTDDTLQKLGNFQTTGTTEFTTIDQQSSSADAIRETLKRIELPDGFTIDLYALVPDARHMAVGPQGIVTFVGTRKTEVWAVTDRDKDRVADEVKNFAPSLAKAIPNGPCFSPEGVLFIAEQNRILAYPAAEFFYESPDVVATPVIAGGELIPEQFVSYNHTARVCDIGPDGKLYVSLGQPYNVAPAEHLNAFGEHGIGGIIRLNQDGSEREVYSRGVRNSVGQDFHPGTGELWFTDNQVDGMGDDIPPGEINRQTQAAQHFGHPWFGGGEVRTNEYKDQEVPVEVVHPVVETEAHAADLGMVFYTGKMFPESYRGGIFSAQHGSWNRTEPIGARIMFTPVDAEGNVTGATQPFAEGWLDGNGEYLGRPVDVAQLRDGSLLVSDDLAGAVYRISYNANAQVAQ